MVRLCQAYWSCGPLVIATASLSFSLTALCVKWIGSELPPFETVSSSAVLCFLALSAILAQQRLPLLRLPPAAATHSASEDVEVGKVGPHRASLRPRPSTARVVLLTLTRAVAGAVATTCFYLALEMLSLKDAVTLFFTSPVVALLLDWLVLGRAPGCRGAAATVLTLLGATCVTQPPFIFKHLPFIHTLGAGGGSSSTGAHGQGAAAAAAAATAAAADLPFFAALRQQGAAQHGSSQQPLQLLLTVANAALLSQPHTAAAAAGCPTMGSPALGVALALAAAAANACGFVAAGLLRGHQHPAVLTWWYNGVLALVTGAPLLAAVPLPAVLPSPRAAALLGGVGATQLVAQLCLNRGFQLESAGRGAAINVLQVLFSFVLDVVALHTRPSLLSVLGSALVAAGVLSVALTGGSGGAGAGAKRGSQARPDYSRGDPPGGCRTTGHPADEGSDGECGTEADAALAAGLGLSWMSASGSGSSDGGGLTTRVCDGLSAPLLPEQQHQSQGQEEEEVEEVEEEAQQQGVEVRAELHATNEVVGDGCEAYAAPSDGPPQQLG